MSFHSKNVSSFIHFSLWMATYYHEAPKFCNYLKNSEYLKIQKYYLILLKFQNWLLNNTIALDGYDFYNCYQIQKLSHLVLQKKAPCPCDIGEFPTSGAHKCKNCGDNVHAIGCSVEIPGESEGYGQKRLCLKCYEDSAGNAENSNLSHPLASSSLTHNDREASPIEESGVTEHDSQV